MAFLLPRSSKEVQRLKTPNKKFYADMSTVDQLIALNKYTDEDIKEVFSSN